MRRKLQKNCNKKMQILSILGVLVIVSIAFVTIGFSLGLFTTNSDGTINSSGNLSGVVDNKVIVDQEEEDWYYYQSLNYTESLDGTIPTGDNQNIYNSDNLVKVHITYSGTSISDSSLIGYVSLTERQNVYEYYKLYPIKDGYVTIDLIENPFTDRPTDKAFNGWVTNYNNATISYDDTYYERYVKIAVNDNSDIDITMHASWVNANVANITSTSNQWSSAFNNLKNKGMVQFGGTVAIYEDVTGLYTQETISGGNWWNRSYYPNGSYDQYGNDISGQQCNPGWGSNTCTYYAKVTENNYDPSITYYKLSNNGWNSQMQTYTPQITGYETLPGIEVGSNVSGYYRKIHVERYSSSAGYYNDLGIYQDSGTCNDRNGCDYYELIQYYDANGAEELALDGIEYYYLVTRDTNIIVMKATTDSVPSSSLNKPYTLTSVYNGNDYRNNVTWNVSNNAVIAYNDLNIENIKINSYSNNDYNGPNSRYNNTSRYFYGNYHNVRLGRGIVQSGNYKTFNAVLAGDNSSYNIGSSNNTTKYKIIIESGFYNSISLSNSSFSSSSSKYLNAKGIYGNDYDKVTNNNSYLDVYFCASSGWGGGNYYASNNSTSLIFDFIVKSGKFGSGKYNYATGIYVGGRGYGDHYAPKKVRVEGGWIYNLIGGPCSNSSRSSLNDIYMYITGGEIDSIVGGAGVSATYGNRIISVTGGTINYNVFGGSNGYQGSSGDGTLNGSSFVYIGGTAVIGSENNVNASNSLWGAEAGSVFGIGNGKNGTDSIGSNDNSNIVIDGKAVVKRNVYGGGNYGATGISSSLSSNSTNIKIKGGTVNGSVYGGGNNNGSGSSSKISNITIEMTDGIIEGSIYGGANKLGVVYGEINLNVTGGTVNGSVYGGGEGGYQSSTNSGTFVTRNINVTIGKENSSNASPVIKTSVYGGSAFGTVNGNTRGTNVSDYETNVNVYSGTINNVFGGGEGSSTYTPYVLGNIEVNIYGGTLNNVYGGNDLKGVPNGSVIVNVRGGEIDNAYAGGNQTSVESPYINLLGGTVNNAFGGGNSAGVTTSNVLLDGANCINIFGGSNNSGDVDLSNVSLKSGSATTVYGGNNLGGITTKTNVIVDGGDINTVYGGGEKTSVGEDTNIILNNKVVNLFGGSNTSGDIPVSYINVNDGVATNIYGGNNAGGITKISNITINGGFIDNVYGGGLKASSITSNINLIYGVITNMYGGGSEAGVNDTHINLNKGNVVNLFGGSNTSGDVTDSYIKNTTSTINNSNLTSSSSFTTSTVNNSGVTDKLSSETISVNIVNNTGKDIVNWDYYLIANSILFDSNWSSTKVWQDGNYIHANQVNQWYGTNTISNGNTHTFSFNVHSKVSYDKFKILGYIIIGYDSDGNEYKTVGFDDVYVTNLFGGNNLGGSTKTSNINLTSGEYDVIYGGGKKADTYLTNVNISDKAIVDTSVYGGGDEAIVNTNTNVSINGAKVLGDVYGGGRQGEVTTDTNVILDSVTIRGSVYAGGDAGKVSGNTILKVDTSNIDGSIYGGGNQATVLGNTTVSSNHNEIANIFGGGNYGAIGGNTSVSVVGGVISDSIYAGGNGTTASVIGNTLLNISDNVNVGKHVFGGGNAATVGCDSDIVTNDNVTLTCNKSDSATGEVNIASATIGGNVYGGANTSRLFGVVDLNIGNDVIDSKYKLVGGDINISGTVFGGGEANASGSEEYDFSYISVTKGINIYIDANGYNNFNISGSIFGSGNASSSGGYSYITISNYGSFDDYKNNISIQRADIVTLDNSAIFLSGAKDRTNKFDNELFTISRVDRLKLKNGSTLFLDRGANLLKRFSSLVDIEGEEVLASVSINSDSKKVEKNVDNRVYMHEGKNLNISDSETLSSYGEVDGMTFFGMFTRDRTGKISTALYSSKYESLDKVSSSELYYFSSGSYVVGLHKTDHDYYKDGFYSNYPSEEGDSIYSDYIIPTPPSASYYRWVIGEDINSIEVKLIASKFSTLGTYELQLLDYYTPNTEIDVLGVNFDDLSSDVSLLNSDDIPRVAKSVEDANKNFGLGMKSGNNGWITVGNTEFLTDSNKVDGTDTYYKDNSTDIPSFVFYLYHSKNLTDTKDLGSVTISLMVVTPIDELSNKVERINIVVKLSTALYDGDNYEATINVGSQYKMFANSNVNITNDGTFSAYYSLFSNSDNTIYNDGYYRALTSSYVLPVDTKITMIDFASGDSPEYYYYVVNSTDYNDGLYEYNREGEVSYKLSKFVKMGSISGGNNYNDEEKNSIYYDNKTKTISEEFIFIVDFSESNIDTDVLSKSFLLELRNSNDNAVIPVLGIAQEKMVFNLYENKDAKVNVSGKLSSDSIYIGDSVTLTATTDFVQDKTNNSSVIYDTKYFDQKMGVKLSLYDENDNLVNGASLFGVSFTYNGSTYYPRVDGTVRFNIAPRVTNVAAKIKINTKNSTLASGNYKILIESFGSSDGIYYGLNASSSTSVNLKVINNIFGMSATMSEKSAIIDAKTGNNLSGTNKVDFTINYDSGLENPNIHISLYRRKYDNVYDMDYDLVDLADYLTSNGFSSSNVLKEYICVSNPDEVNSVSIRFKENLPTGTYKVVFSLYDGNSYIGNIYKYIIIE